ncbi:R3HC1 protein, partial [Aegithalos caudatus]|nr:R3HC1 protein [Aegithalos caudatus]
PAATLALRSMDGVFLSPTEDEFVGRIAEELEHFMVQGQHQRVLLFPPLSSRLRYLIHRTVENMELLSSFSVGEGWRRRTVICHSAVRLPKEPTSDQKPGHVAGRAQRPGQPWGRGGPGDPHGDNSRAPVGSGRIFRPARRKPDKALFVPKSTRKKSNWRERDNDGDAAPGGENRPRNSMGDAQQEEGKGGNCPGKRQEPEEGNVQDGGSPGKQQEPEEGNVQGEGSPGKQQGPEEGNVQDGGSPGKQQEPEEGNVQDGGSPGKRQEPEEGNVQDGGSPGKRQEPEEGNVQDGGSAEHPLKRIQAGKVPREEEEEEEEEQEPTEGTRQSSLQEECTAELLAEIMGNLTVKDISIERISLDYPSSGEPQLTEGDLGHVTEIHDFPSSLKTEELMEMFSDFHESGFKIHWVDDTHALGIFSSPSTASQALGRRYPCLKIRPLIHATKQSKIRALQRPKLLQLGKERPQTDTAVARRLVSHALGWRNRQQEPAGSEVFQPESLDQQE